MVQSISKQLGEISKGDYVTDSNNGLHNRREFIQGALAGATLAVLPINAFSAVNPDMQAVLPRSPRCMTRT